MSSQYWVGDFFVDLSRNQISRSQQSLTLAPKALAVLTCLAEKQGQVVSQDTLLSSVWGDTIVSPNTLQRSIAQLRKALGDDGRVQVYIKTHAKQGYSLECDVRWPDQSDSSPTESGNEPVVKNPSSHFTSRSSGEEERSAYWKPGFILLLLISGAVFVGGAAYQKLSPTQTTALSVKNVRALTATDDKEFDATYTPDGHYIVFHRYLDKQCVNRVWAKDMRTQQETQLTKEWAAYGRHSFSQDGKKLVFLATEACTEPRTQTDCYDLMSLNFDEALKNPQQPTILMRCQNSRVRNPVWMNNNRIALLQQIEKRWKLISYSAEQNESEDIYKLNDGNVVHFTYSAKDDLLAVIRTHDDDQLHLDLLKPDGRIVSRSPIEHSSDIPKARLIYPTFDPRHDQLIFSTGRQLFTLSYDGKITKTNLPFTERMVQPEFHPSGKRLLMLKGPYDSDIVLHQFRDLGEIGGGERTQTSKSFQRSNLGEDFAKFQPGGDLIAFWSERSGEQQLWLANGSYSKQSPKQLTHFPIDTTIRGIDWAADGQSLLVNANYQLTQVFVDSGQRALPLAFPVIRLFQWDSIDNTALMIARIDGLPTFVEVDLDNSTLKKLSDKIVLFALKSADGRLIYKDHLDQFWQPGPAEPQRIPELNQQSRAKSFAMNGNVIYAINRDNQIWSYDLDTQSFTVIGEVGADVDYLTDVDDTRVAITIEVAAKKEVVELTLGN